MLRNAGWDWEGEDESGDVGWAGMVRQWWCVMVRAGNTAGLRDGMYRLRRQRM